MSELNYARDIAIDESSLELEWLHHSALYMEYCRASALASKLAKEAAHHQKVTYADLLLKSSDALITLNQKVTEGTKDAWVLLHPDYARATQGRFDAEHNADQLQNAVYAFGHRKEALQELCALEARSYFSRPREPRNLTPEVKQAWLDAKNSTKEDLRDTVSTGVRERLNSRRSIPES